VLIISNKLICFTKQIDLLIIQQAPKDVLLRVATTVLLVDSPPQIQMVIHPVMHDGCSLSQPMGLPQQLPCYLASSLIIASKSNLLQAIVI